MLKTKPLQAINLLKGKEIRNPCAWESKSLPNAVSGPMVQHYYHRDNIATPPIAIAIVTVMGCVEILIPRH